MHKYVDQNPETVPEGAGSQGGAQFYHMKQPAMGLHALHTQPEENWLVQCAPSELTAE